jgi:hypothetical protein
MIKALFSLAAIAVCAGAAPLCGDATADIYASYGSEGCLAGQFTIKNVAWNSLAPTASHPERVLVSASDVFITPILTGGKVGVGFRSEKFFAGSGQTITGFLDYLIDPPPPILDDFSLSMATTTPENGGTAIFNATVCA